MAGMSAPMGAVVVGGGSFLLFGSESAEEPRVVDCGKKEVRRRGRDVTASAAEMPVRHDELSGQPVAAVSYTHLTLPTNREV